MSVQKVKLTTMSNKRKVKVELELEAEKMIKVGDYCFSCQKYGHIISEKCVASAVCLNCGTKGHVRRDCQAEKIPIKDEIKAEDKTDIKKEIKFEDKNEMKKEIKSEVKSEIKMEIKSEVQNEIKKEIKSEIKSEIKMEIKTEVKSEINQRGDQIETTEENEYIEQEIPKDEPHTDEESESESEYIEKEDDGDLTKVKVEMYCILCQTYGHAFTEACVVNARCITCGVKGHARRDCLVKYEKLEVKNVKLEVKREKDKFEPRKESIIYLEEYVEAETENDKLKSEDNLEGNNVDTGVEDEVVTLSAKTSEENMETDGQNDMNLKSTHSVKKCTINLVKVNIKLYEKAPEKINREAKHKKINIRYCKECNFKSKYRNILRRHIQGQHKGVRYTCKECDYKTKRKDNLAVHIQGQHKGVRYACKECDYKGKYKWRLAEHMKAKHEDVKYSCKKCSYETNYKKNLTEHMQAKHGGESYFVRNATSSRNTKETSGYT